MVVPLDIAQMNSIVGVARGVVDADSVAGRNDQAEVGSTVIGQHDGVDKRGGEVRGRNGLPG